MCQQVSKSKYLKLCAADILTHSGQLSTSHGTKRTASHSFKEGLLQWGQTSFPYCVYAGMQFSVCLCLPSLSLSYSLLVSAAPFCSFCDIAFMCLFQGGGSQAQSHLSKLMQAVESYNHPSNLGQHTVGRCLANGHASICSSRTLNCISDCCACFLTTF